ncbi:hypothetical protein ACIPRI_04530 [Variovorax sp. LARHSF232]
MTAAQLALHFVGEAVRTFLAMQGTGAPLHCLGGQHLIGQRLKIHCANFRALMKRSCRARGPVWRRCSTLTK